MNKHFYKINKFNEPNLDLSDLYAFIKYLDALYTAKIISPILNVYFIIVDLYASKPIIEYEYEVLEDAIETSHNSMQVILHYNYCKHSALKIDKSIVIGLNKYEHFLNKDNKKNIEKLFYEYCGDKRTKLVRIMI